MKTKKCACGRMFDPDFDTMCLVCWDSKRIKKQLEYLAAAKKCKCGTAIPSTDIMCYSCRVYGKSAFAIWRDSESKKEPKQAKHLGLAVCRASDIFPREAPNEKICT